MFIDTFRSYISTRACIKTSYKHSCICSEVTQSLVHMLQVTQSLVHMYVSWCTRQYACASHISARQYVCASLHTCSRMCVCSYEHMYACLTVVSAFGGTLVSMRMRVLIYVMKAVIHTHTHIHETFQVCVFTQTHTHTHIPGGHNASKCWTTQQN